MGVLLADDAPNVGLLLIGQWHGARLEPLGEGSILGGLGALSGYKNGARTTDCLGVVFGCGLKVMFCRHSRAVADPLADHVARKLFFQLRLSRGPQVLPQLGPRAYILPIPSK